MFRRHQLAVFVAATLLCVAADFGLTPFDDDGLISHRTRSTRSARNDSDHDLAVLHEPEHGAGVQELSRAHGLVIQAGVAANSVQTPVAEFTVQIAFAQSLDAGELIDPLVSDVPTPRPIAPRPGRAPPAA